MKNQTVALLALMTLAGTTFAAPRESQSAPAVIEVPADPAFSTFSLSFTGSDAGGVYNATRIRFNGTMTAVAPFTYAYDTIVTVTPPDGGAGIAVRMSQLYDSYDTLTISVNASLGRSVAPAGTWSFDCTDDFEDGDGSTPESTLDGLVVTLDDQALAAPTAVDLGTLVDGTLVSRDLTVDAEGVNWFKMTVDAATTVNTRRLDINTLGSVSGGDSEIGLYTNAGALVDANDDAGAAAYSQLTFGTEGANGDLAAGEYYLAVSTYDATFLNSSWDATSNGPGGAFHLDVLQSLVVPPAGTWNEAVNGGGDAGQDLATVQVVGGSGPLPRIEGSFEANDVDIYRINICDAAGFSATTGGTLPVIDTQLFLFNLDGTGVVMNDDNATGAGGLWSKIDNSTGFIAAPGEYLLAVGRWDIDPIDAGGSPLWLDTPFNTQRQPDGAGAASPFASWDGTNANSGDYRIDLTGACRASAGPVCGPADLGGTGGVAGADGHLDNNDFIVYIDNFFNNLASADIGTTGGVAGSDGLWDNNDFIVFIDQFFAAPASCR